MDEWREIREHASEWKMTKRSEEDREEKKETVMLIEVLGNAELRYDGRGFMAHDNTQRR